MYRKRIARKVCEKFFRVDFRKIWFIYEKTPNLVVENQVCWSFLCVIILLALLSGFEPSNPPAPPPPSVRLCHQVNASSFGFDFGAVSLKQCFVERWCSESCAYWTYPIYLKRKKEERNKMTMKVREVRALLRETRGR